MGLSFKDLKVINNGCAVSFRIPRQKAWHKKKRINVINHKRSFSSLSANVLIQFNQLAWKSNKPGAKRVSTKLVGRIVARSVISKSITYRNVKVHVRVIDLSVDHIFTADVEFHEPGVIWIMEV